MTGPDEGRLHRAVLAGDTEAWQALYDAAYAALERYVLWRCAGLRDVADDVVQETWLTAVRRIGDFDPRRGRFLAWLRGIAANALRSHLRRKRTLPLTGDYPEPSTSAPDDAEQVALALALARLPANYEAVLRAKYLDGLSVAVIATERATTPKAVESLLTRARDAFRAAYQQIDGPLLYEAEP